MRDLGREAIWFDYATATLPSFLKAYDLILQAPAENSIANSPASSGGASTRTIQKSDTAEKVRDVILNAVGKERRDSWKAFLNAREPEVRSKHPQVANYEKRPEALTFQHPYTPKGSLERVQVPADCEVKLFASEPDIAKPIAFAWDERGRCWVVETRDYPHGVSPTGGGQDTIKICEDTDGDGRADRFTVFAEGLNLPTGIVFANGGIIVAQPPQFLFLKDTDGDDRADVKQVVMDCWGIKDTHAQASNLHYGLDNWLYGAVGYSGIEGVVNGEKVRFSMGSYRFRADGSAIEFLHQFTNNTWAQSFNDAGDSFGGTANGAPLFFGGIPATVFPKGMRGLTAKKINEVELCHTITPNFRQVDVFGGYTSAAGSNFIYSKAIPARFQGMAMVCEPTMKTVSLMDVRQQGAGYTAKDGYNLFASSDEWASPVHAEVGPDGAVWVADFQNFIIQHNPTPSVERGGFVGTTGGGGAHENDLRDHERGRIYRIYAKGADTKVQTPSLDADTQTARLTAQRLMVEGKLSFEAEKLKERVKNPNGQVGAIHALWVLHGTGHLDEATHRSALLAGDDRLRRNAIRALGKDEKAQELLFGTGVISDPHAGTRLAALVKMAEFTTTAEIRTLVEKLSGDSVIKGDEWLSEAVRVLARKHGANTFKEGPNLLSNGDFEKLGADGLPDGWKKRDYGKQPGNDGAEWKAVTGEGMSHGGKVGVRCITRQNGDTSLYQDVPLKRGATYRLSGWVKTHAFRGKVSFNDHLGRAETEQDTARESDWNEVEVVFTNKDRDLASINLLHVGKGDGYFDEVRLCELIESQAEEVVLAGNVQRGEEIFWKHPVAACKNCHVLKGQGSTVGPALDGIAGRKDKAYLIESLVNPNGKLAEGFEKLGISPMPPMNLILKPQELADVEAFILSLK